MTGMATTVVTAISLPEQEPPWLEEVAGPNEDVCLLALKLPRPGSPYGNAGSDCLLDGGTWETGDLRGPTCCSAAARS